MRPKEEITARKDIMMRKIISIDESKCTGCGQCIPDCPEGALQVIEGKARLVSDLFCDGLGACIGTCPEGVICVVEREAGAYDEKIVMENIAPQGEEVIRAHLEHLIGHRQAGFYRQAIEFLGDHRIPVPRHKGPECHEGSGQPGHNPFAACPGAVPMEIARDALPGGVTGSASAGSALRQWPIQSRLLNPEASYFDNADLLISADCVPFAYGDFHRDFLMDRIVIMFCPKLDADIEEYVTKLSEIFTRHTIKSITVLRMEVPCCGGVRFVVDKALGKAGRRIPVAEQTITIAGEIRQGGSDPFSSRQGGPS